MSNYRIIIADEGYVVCDNNGIMAGLAMSWEEAQDIIISLI